MKTVYADIVLLVNFCSDYILLYLCSCFLHIKAPLLRTVCACTLGAVYALLAIIFPVLKYLYVPIIMMMCLVTFGKRSMMTYVRILFVIFVFSFMLAGILEFAGLRHVNEKGILYSAGITATGFVAFYFISVFSQRILQYQLNTKSVQAKIELKNKILDIVLLSDSGNLLTEPESNKSVIVLDSKHRCFFSENCNSDKLMMFKTVSGSGIIELYKADMILANNNEIDAYIGFCINDACSFDGCDGIIPAILVQNF